MADIKIHHRDTCRLCLSDNVELVIPFKPAAIAEKYVKEIPLTADPLVPVDLYMCISCGHVQILDVIDPQYLWGDYTYHSGQTQGIIDHFSDVSHHIMTKYGKVDSRFIIDVGSNDGTLLRFFLEKNYQVLGIDPATEIAAKATASGIETIPSLLTEKLANKVVAQYGKADLITAFNVFAHADEMVDLGRSIQQMLAKDGVFIFEVSYLLDIVNKMLVGTIFHEHLCNHSLAPMKTFLALVGLEIFDVERVSIQGGSIIGYAQQVNGPKTIQPSVDELLALEEKEGLHTVERMHKFNGELANMKGQVQNILSTYREKNLVIAGYGAARSGPMLIAQFGLAKAIEYVFDDHPQKLGKLTPGDYLPVLPTQALEEEMPAVTIILAWIHAKNIIKKHQSYLNNGGKFLVLSPEIKLYSKDDINEL